MNTIQVRAQHANTADITADVQSVDAQTGPLETRREILPETAVAIAGWWQSAGRGVGHVLASFASGCEVDRTALLDDIHQNRVEYLHKDMAFDHLALDCLATFVINHK